jgi:hypothetical protein
MDPKENFIENQKRLVALDNHSSQNSNGQNSRMQKIISGEGELPEEEGDHDDDFDNEAEEILSLNDENQIDHLKKANPADLYPPSMGTMGNDQFGLQSQVIQVDISNSNPSALNQKSQFMYRPEKIYESAFSEESEGERDASDHSVNDDLSTPDNKVPLLNSEILEPKLVYPVQQNHNFNNIIKTVKVEKTTTVTQVVTSQEMYSGQSIQQQKMPVLQNSFNQQLSGSSQVLKTKEYIFNEDNNEGESSEEESAPVLVTSNKNSETANKTNSTIISGSSNKGRSLSKILPTTILKQQNSNVVNDNSGVDNDIGQSSSQNQEYASNLIWKKEDSFHFEDESYDEDFNNEDIEQDDSNIKIFENLIDANGKARVKKKYIEKSRMSKVYCMLGFFVLFFLVSTVLWILLLGVLHSENNALGEIILFPPTLGIYFGKYKKFFLEYDKSRVAMTGIAKLISPDQDFDEYGEEYDEDSSQIYSQNEINFKDYHDKLDYLDILKKDMNDEMQNIKERIEIYQEKGAPTGIKYNGTPSSKSASNIAETLEDLKKEVHYIQAAKHKYTLKDKQVGEILRRLYYESSNLIDLYGDFYKITSRIWVTSNNIYELYNARAVQINTEMEFHHYAQISQEAKDITLKVTASNSFVQVRKFPVIEIKTERPIYLTCYLRSQINNADLKDTSNIYDLVLAANEDRGYMNSRKFKYEITGSRDTSSFVAMFHLEKGDNEIKLFAGVSKGDVRLKEVSVQCFEAYPFMRFPEYEK